MTTIKTDDLTPAQINMLVAVAEGMEAPSADVRLGAWYRQLVPHYCTEQIEGGRIIDREHITTVWDGRAKDGYRRWNAYAFPGDGVWPPHYDRAEDRLEAAMRAYVRKIYGDTIDTTDKPWLLEAAAS